MSTTLAFNATPQGSAGWCSPSTEPALTTTHALVPNSGTVTFAALEALAEERSTSSEHLANEWREWQERFVCPMANAMLDRFRDVDALGALGRLVANSPPKTWHILGSDEGFRLEVAPPTCWTTRVLAAQIRSESTRMASRGPTSTVRYSLGETPPALSGWFFSAESLSLPNIVIEDLAAGDEEPFDVDPEMLRAMDAEVDRFENRRARARAEHRRLAKFDRE